MSVTIASLGLDNLSRAERVALASELLDSVGTGSPVAPTEAQAEELDRRLAEDEASPDDLIPWEQVKAEARARHLS